VERDKRASGQPRREQEAAAGGASTRARQERRSSRAMSWDGAWAPCTVSPRQERAGAALGRAGAVDGGTQFRNGRELEGSGGRRGQERTLGVFDARERVVCVCVDVGARGDVCRCGSPQLAVEVCWKAQPTHALALPRSLWPGIMLLAWRPTHEQASSEPHIHQPHVVPTADGSALAHGLSSRAHGHWQTCDSSECYGT
jgi:hypothetical protein